MCLQVLGLSSNSPDITTSLSASYKVSRDCDECIFINTPSDCCCGPNITNITYSFQQNGGWTYSVFFDLIDCNSCCDVNVQYSTVSPNGPWLGFIGSVNFSCTSPQTVNNGPIPNSFTNLFFRVVKICCDPLSEGACPPAGDRSSVICQQVSGFSNTYTITRIQGCNIYSMTREPLGYTTLTNISRYAQPPTSLATNIWYEDIEVQLSSGSLTTFANIYSPTNKMYFADMNNIYEFTTTATNFNPIYNRTINVTGGNIIKIANNQPGTNNILHYVKSVLGVQKMYRVNIATSTPVETFLFDLPSGGTLNGSIHLYEEPSSFVLPITVGVDTYLVDIIYNQFTFTYSVQSTTQKLNLPVSNGASGPFFPFPGITLPQFYVATVNGAVFNITFSSGNYVFTLVSGDMIPGPPGTTYTTITDLTHDPKCAPWGLP